MLKKAAFLDRDGVINADRGYVHHPADFVFIDGAFAACRHLQRGGYLLVIVTNQSGIARGLYSETDFQNLTAWMRKRFQEEGVDITAVYHCPHHPEHGAVAAGGCPCRKPAPGMLTRAITELDIAPEASLMIGDKESDMQAAAAAGIKRKILVRASRQINPQAERLADEVWDSIKETMTAVTIAPADNNYHHGNR
ncbi:MAG: D-glycero-beta-D-manno-heptose 1,7-bisphosphate 7-phosphatase [Desulfurivibrio sp.]|nr:D-glycero-beta-D-manno-heptose 1,7-bisphosphate 7-phosphatase [Desulfurivibrio sp.]